MIAQAAMRPRQTIILDGSDIPGCADTPCRLPARLFRVAVSGRAAFNHICDIDVVFPGQADMGQHFVKQLSGAAYKGFSLQIFVFARPSPMNITFACGLPTPNTTFFRVSHSLQARQFTAISRSSSKFSIIGKDSFRE
jgi:hypothetical protein